MNKVKNIFYLFEKHNVEYVVSRNYSSILKNEIYTGKDIDVCISKKSLKKAKKIFENEGFINYPINPFSNHLGYIKMIVDERKILFFHIHIGGITGKHLKYLDSKDLLNSRIKNKFIYTPSKNYEFLVILLHSILDKSKIRESYRKDLTKFFSKDKEVISKLNKVIGKKYTNQILKLVGKKEFDKIEKNSYKIKKYFLDNYPNKYLALARVYVLGGMWKLGWIMRSKPLISFIGMDGAGKTTTSNEIIQILKENNLKVKYIYSGRGKNNILPIQFIGKGYSKAGGKTSIGKEEKGIKKISLMHTLAAPVFAFDLWLRYFFQILPERKKNHFVITDRYSTDILLMNKVPMFLKRIMFAFYPKPTQVFYIYNDPKVLNSRKGDHPIEDLYRQEKIFKKINSILKPNRIKNDELEETKSNILNKLFEKPKL